MNRQRLVLDLASFTLLSGLALACSSRVAGDGGTDEGATVVEPNGTDHPGNVVVVAPSDDALEKTEYDLKSPFGHAAPVTHALGQPFTDLATGSYSVTLRTEGPTYSVTTRRDVQVDANSTTVRAGLLAIDARTAGLRIFGLGGDAHASDMSINAASDMTLTGAGRAKISADGTTFAALLPDAYQISFGFGDGTAAAVGAGEKTTVVLRSAPDRRVAHLVASTAPRAFPTGACGGELGPDEYFVTRDGSGKKEKIKLADGETIEFGAGPKRPDPLYSVETNTLRQFTLPLGEVGGPPAVTQFGRIDVDDVLVNATQPRVKGRYQIERQNVNGWFTNCSLPTKTGVDVPFGKYVVTVRYQTVEAGEKQESYVVDVN